MVDAGDFVFANAVFIANVKILVASYEISGGILITVLLSILSYIISAFIVSETGIFIDTEFYLNQQKLATFPAVYFALFLFLTSFALIDRALENLRKMQKIRLNFIWNKKEIVANEIESKREDLVKDKQTDYAHSGYAFS